MKYKYLIISVFCFHFVCLNAQKLQPTQTEALLTVSVKSMSDKPRAGEIIQLTGNKNKKRHSGITDKDGNISFLLPKGDTYQISYKTLSGDMKHDHIAISNETGLLTFIYTIKYDPPTSYTLENVFFDTGKSTLRPKSYATLNNLVELMKAKPNLIIEISGHTDSIGSAESNLRLSSDRAKSVKNYIVNKGVSEKRIQTKGYGDTQPIAPNHTEEGRQQNRRTMVKIISD